MLLETPIFRTKLFLKAMTTRLMNSCRPGRTRPSNFYAGSPDLGEGLGPSTLRLLVACQVVVLVCSRVPGKSTAWPRAVNADIHTREHGYEEVYVPFLVNRDSMFGTDNSQFAEDPLSWKAIQALLIPLEVPVTNLFRIRFSVTTLWDRMAFSMLHTLFSE